MLSAILLLLALSGTGSAQVPPDAAWRTLETARFRVTYMEGLDTLASRAAARAEWAYDVLAAEFTSPPRGKIEIVLTDGVDYANGLATPLPTNRIVLYAHPPTDVAELSYTTDWLELLVLHELVHIFHLDQSGGVWDVLRHLFGRAPVTFPNALAPDWLIEGLATYYESALTPGGRVRGTLFDMMLRTAVLEGDSFSLDRASGIPRTWPGGRTSYLYGALFLDYLAAQEDSAGFGSFVERYGAQTIPYRLNRAAQESLGDSFSDAWREWQRTLQRRYAAVADSVRETGITQAEVLTPAGRDAYHPRFSPDGSRIAYSAATGRDQPGIRVIEAGGDERELVPRAQLGPLAWYPDGRHLLYGDLQFRGPHRILSDLWSATVHGDARRLTRGERVWEADLHPDGTTVVAVANAGGSSRLVIGAPEEGELRTIGETSPDIHWAEPRWSPTGDTIAAVRWGRDGLHDIVLIDPTGRVLREVTSDRAVEGSPTWAPDGRHLLFWSDRSGIPNLYAYDLGNDRLLQVSNVISGAFHPDVSPDGQWIAFSLYRADGYHIARMSFDPARWRAAGDPAPHALPIASSRDHPPVDGVQRPYSPWPSVAPSSWTLIPAGGTSLGPGLGVLLAGHDVVRRHLWAASAIVYGEGGRVEGGGVYRYQGWGNPTLELFGSQEWDVVCAEGSPVCGSSQPLPTALLRREREAGVSLVWLRQRMRSSAWIRPALAVEGRDVLWKEDDAVGGIPLRQVPADLSLRMELGRSSVRAFPLSVGPQAGFSVVAAAEGHRYVEPLEGDRDATGYLRAVARGRGYRSIPVGSASHVLALRADAGLDVGSRSPGFDVGGASGGELPLAVGGDALGGGLAFPIRGYGEGVQFGNRAVSVSGEYRFPLLRVERGLGLLPLYLDRVSGDLFADAGGAWCPGECPTRFAAASAEPDFVSSIGAEVVAELRFGFQTQLPLRFGAALPLQLDRDPELYLRVGRSF